MTRRVPWEEVDGNAVFQPGKSDEGRWLVCKTPIAASRPRDAPQSSWRDLMLVGDPYSAAPPSTLATGEPRRTRHQHPGHFFASVDSRDHLVVLIDVPSHGRVFHRRCRSSHPLSDQPIAFSLTSEILSVNDKLSRTLVEMPGRVGG